MKKVLVSFLLFVGCITSYCQPNITNLSYPSTVSLFGKYEISFRMSQYSNPYDPEIINVYAVFTGPNNEKDTVLGFYYEGYTFQQINGYENAISNPFDFGWRIRFTPDAIGYWRFHIHAIDQGGETVIPNVKPMPCSFNCISVNSADGFITKANNRYLKRRIVKNGQNKDQSYFPIGPNIAWYSCNSYWDWDKPKGIYDYERYIDSLNGNGNYMRIWLNRYQRMNFYGPEYTQLENGNPRIYFDNSINQKDAAELDHIITYAYQNHISLMMCIFSYGDFRYSNSQDPGDPTKWANNPYNTILSFPCLFFADTDAKKIAKNLIRYIVARWGYATNIMSWELWNEVTNVSSTGCFQYLFRTMVLNWHEEMSNYIKDIDPFNHCVSTSMSNYESYSSLYSSLYSNLDFVQRHNYQSINKAKSKEQFSYILFNLSKDAHVDYPNKSFFIGEFGFGNADSYNSKDPYGIDLHNSLWSSLFSTSMGPASFWWWSYLDEQDLFKRYNPIHTFCQDLPIPSETFQAYTTGAVSGDQLLFPNNLETYFMKNSTEDTIYGWSQDTAFCYQSLRWLTDSVATHPNGLHFVDSVVFDPNGYVYTLNPQKKPRPSSNSNEILIYLQNVPVGTQYEVHWFNSETGFEYSNYSSYTTVEQTLLGRKYIVISFPSSIRNLNTHTITNTFGDAVFAIYRNTQKKQEKNNL